MLLSSSLPSSSNPGSSSSSKSDGSTTWNFTYNLPIPGWLPATSTFGCDMHGAAGTRYTLYADAAFAPLGDNGIVHSGHTRAWSIAASLCGSLTAPRARIVRARKCAIEIVRVAQPEPEFGFDPECSDAKPFGDQTFVVDSHSSHPTREDGKHTRIPVEILRAIEVLATVPEAIPIDAPHLNLAVRLRAASLSPEQQRRLRLTDFEIKLTQTEHYHTSPQASYTAQFPLPEKDMQVESVPLRNPHATKSMYDIGLITLPGGNAAASEEVEGSYAASFSLLPEKHSGRHRLPRGGVCFAHAQKTSEEESEPKSPAWCKLEVAVPFAHVNVHDDEEWERMHGRVKALRPTEETPLFCVHHELEVDLTCAYDPEDPVPSKDGKRPKPAVERLVFAVPVTFARVPPPKRAQNLKDIITGAQSITSEPANLPAYSQLFHPNGDRKINHTIPLPLYTPRASDPTEPSPPYELSELKL